MGIHPCLYRAGFLRACFDRRDEEVRTWVSLGKELVGFFVESIGIVASSGWPWSEEGSGMLSGPTSLRCTMGTSSSKSGNSGSIKDTNRALVDFTRWRPLIVVEQSSFKIS